MNIHTITECLITLVLTLKTLSFQHSKQTGVVVVNNKGIEEKTIKYNK